MTTSDERQLTERHKQAKPGDSAGWVVLTSQLDGTWQPDWDGTAHRWRDTAQTAYADAERQLGAENVRLAVLKVETPSFNVGELIEAKSSYTSITGDVIEEGKRYRVAAVDDGGYPMLEGHSPRGGGWLPQQFRRVHEGEDTSQESK